MPDVEYGVYLSRTTLCCEFAYVRAAAAKQYETVGVVVGFNPPQPQTPFHVVRTSCETMVVVAPASNFHRQTLAKVTDSGLPDCDALLFLNICDCVSTKVVGATVWTRPPNRLIPPNPVPVYLKRALRPANKKLVRAMIRMGLTSGQIQWVCAAWSIKGGRAPFFKKAAEASADGLKDWCTAHGKIPFAGFSGREKKAHIFRCAHIGYGEKFMPPLSQAISGTGAFTWIW